MALTIPTTDDVASLADWAELLILTRYNTGLSTARVTELLRGEGTDEAEEELKALEDEVGAGSLEVAEIDIGRGEREVRLEKLLDEMSRRRALGPSLYPFDITEDRLVQRPAAGEHIYVFLLVISSKEASFRRERRAHQIEAAFDEVALEALRRYLGRDARGIRFARNAHDPNDNTQRPGKFKAAVEWLRKELQLGPKEEPPDDETEAHWEATNGSHQPLNSYKDGGVDLVVWWRFADNKAGAPVLFGQCTLQVQWAEKTRDIPVKLWEKWIDFETVPPQTALVIPFAVGDTMEQWANRTVMAGVIIDRMRLLELLNELSDAALSAMPSQIAREWVARELRSLS